MASFRGLMCPIVLPYQEMRFLMLSAPAAGLAYLSRSSMCRRMTRHFSSRVGSGPGIPWVRS